MHTRPKDLRGGQATDEARARGLGLSSQQAARAPIAVRGGPRDVGELPERGFHAQRTGQAVGYHGPPNRLVTNSGISVIRLRMEGVAGVRVRPNQPVRAAW